jgi:hypothetical protein
MEKRMNHTNRTDSRREGKALAERIMAARAGNAGVRINGEIVQWNSIKSKSRLHVGDASIPVDQLHAHLTAHELAALENLPAWDGNNAYNISLTCLVLIDAAIRRYAGPDFGSDRFPPRIPVEDQEAELSKCRCCNCAAKNGEES